MLIYLSLCLLHKGLPSYKRSLQPLKKNIQHFKKDAIYELFSIFLGHFFPLRSGDGSRVPIESIRIHNKYFDSVLYITYLPCLKSRDSRIFYDSKNTKLLG